MNKKALIGTLILAAVLVVLIVIAVSYYTGHFGFKTGKVTVNVEYDREAGAPGDEIRIVEDFGEEPPEDDVPVVNESFWNATYQNISEENQSSISAQES